MNDLSGLFHALLPLLSLIVCVFIALIMITLARNRKAGAIAFGLFIQIFLPDPKAQITIEAVVERKQEVKKAQGGNKTPKNKDDGPHEL